MAVLESLPALTSRPGRLFQSTGEVIRGGTGTVIGLRGTVQDISERAEAELEHKKLLSIFDASQDAILVKDLDGVVLMWNPAAQRLYGFSPDEAIGQPLSALIIPEAAAGEELAIVARVSRGEAVRHYETSRRHKDGTMVDVSVAADGIRGESGRIVEIMVVARDITGQRAGGKRA